MNTLPDGLRAEVDGAVTILSLARPQKRNALNDNMVRGIGEFFRGLSSATRAVVVAADGDHFSAGLDLSEMADRDTFAGIMHSQMWHRAFREVEFGPVPVVSALHGAVVGGGLELAVSTHIRVSERSTFYALPEGQRGLFVGGGASVRLPRLIGVPRMMDMMLTGRRYSADEGERLGFSQYVVDDGAGLETALRLAHRIAKNPPQTNYAVTQALPLVAQANPREGSMLESLIAAAAQGTDDAKERMADFISGRGAKVARPDEQRPGSVGAVR